MCSQPSGPTWLGAFLREKRTSKSDIYIQDGPKNEARDFKFKGQTGASMVTKWREDRFSWDSAIYIYTPRAARSFTPPLLPLGYSGMNALWLRGKTADEGPQWNLGFCRSPVEQKIAYCELGNDRRTAIVTINANGAGRTEITKMGEVRCAVGNACS